MQHPFVLMRCVCFAFLGYMNVLAIGFGAWNFVALRSLGLGEMIFVPIFALVNACLLLALFALCFVGYMTVPSIPTERVAFEIGWTAVMSFSQLTSAVIVSVDGPLILCSEGALSACASSAVVLALTWISSSTLLVYFIALLTFTYSHSHDSPEVWTSSVYEFPWFKREDRESQLNRHTVHFPTPDREARPKSSSALTSEAESPRRRVPPDAPSMESFRPLWAKDGIPPIRGIDPPFARPKKVLQSRWSDSSLDSPVLPPKAHRPAPSGAIYFSMEGSAMLPAISPGRPLSYGMFPEDVCDQDRPIATTRPTRWVKADNSPRISPS